jgi:3-isopropylmalate/(R)-2-methylmalate dehydratase large subunit
LLQTKKTFDFLEVCMRRKVKLGPQLHIGNIKNRYGRCFDSEVTINAADIEPMITYGTNPGMGIGISATIPTASQKQGGAETYKNL